MTDSRVVVVTGGASGIGAAVVRAFANAGDQVISLDRDAVPERDRVAAVRVDVCDPEAVAAAFRQVGTLVPRVDVLINSAGIGAGGRVEDVGDREWFDVFDVNVFGLVRVTREALPLMAASDRGAIVNISSVVAHVGFPERPLYSASKGAVEAFSRALARDLVDRGITVNCVAPGYVDTAWLQRRFTDNQQLDAERERLSGRHPIDRMASADEVAGAVLYLASPEARFVTGVSLPVDGGLGALLHPRL